MTGPAWRSPLILAVTIGFAAQFPLSAARGDTFLIADHTWQSTLTEPAAGWNTDLSVSDPANWHDSFEFIHPISLQAAIWPSSELDSNGVSEAWFRKVFTLPEIYTIWMDVSVDDLVDIYINGESPLPRGQNWHIDVTPSFRPGDNLFAVHVIDTGGIRFLDSTLNIYSFPEPASLGMLGLGIAGLLVRRRC